MLIAMIAPAEAAMNPMRRGRVPARMAMLM
jgi:hypothetical protein